MNGAGFLRAASAVALLVPAAACGDDSSRATTVTLVSYSSFPDQGTGINEALAEFSADTGISVRIVDAGDAGTMVTKAVLTAGNPEGDVMWGVDNTLLAAATAGEIFDDAPVAVDFGDVCVNYDIAWFAERDIAPPATLDDLLAPEYADLLVVQDPAASSPGLAFLIATVAAKGEAWPQYWEALRDNGVEVAESWDTAYFERFSGAAGGSGDKPLVVSYGTSPPAEVVFADPPRDDAPTGVAVGTCFRQVEYAGVLRGTEHADAARRLVEFMTSERFQRELPFSMFVYPIDESVELPDVFTRYAVVPDAPYSLDPEQIAAGREQWLEQWRRIVLD